MKRQTVFLLMVLLLLGGCVDRSAPGSVAGRTSAENKTISVGDSPKTVKRPSFSVGATVSAAGNGTVTKADNGRTTATVSAPPQKTDVAQTGQSRTASDTTGTQRTTAAGVARPTNRQTNSGTATTSAVNTTTVTKAPTAATTAAATAKPTEKDPWQYPYDIDEITRYCRAKIEAAGKVWDETLTPDNASWNPAPDTVGNTLYPQYYLKDDLDEWMRNELSALSSGQNRIRIYFEPMKDYPGDYSIYFLNTGRR